MPSLQKLVAVTLALSVIDLGQVASGPGQLAAAESGTPQAANEKPTELSPEEKMRKRFPQPVRTGDLVGLPVLDENDSTIGYIEQVVRMEDGKVRLIVPYGQWFGFLRNPPLLKRRRVAVPIEVVAILAKQVNAIDMSRQDFDNAATWTSAADPPIPANETIQIAVGRR